MRRFVVTIALCVLLDAAVAQCATQAPPLANAVRPSGELIKTAAADTREGQAVAHSASAAPAQEKRPHRTGTAMLFAALALMSGIALRRYSVPKQ